MDETSNQFLLVLLLHLEYRHIMLGIERKEGNGV